MAIIDFEDLYMCYIMMIQFYSHKNYMQLYKSYNVLRH